MATGYLPDPQEEAGAAVRMIWSRSRERLVRRGILCDV